VARANLIGGGNPQGQGNQAFGAMAGLVSGSSGNDAAFRMNMGNMLGAEKRDIGLAGLSRIRMSEQERARSQGILRDLRDRRLDLQERIPDIRQRVGRGLRTEAGQLQNQRFTQGLARKEFGLKKNELGLQKQNQQFTQNLARDQFGLERDKFDFSKKQARWANKQGWATIGIQQGQLKLEADKLQASINQARKHGHPGAAARAKARAEAWLRGVDALHEFMAPQTKKEKKHPRTVFAARNPEELFNVLHNQQRIPRAMALRLIRTVNHPGWRHYGHVSAETRSSNILGHAR
jgi:hypothetical protein